MDVIHLTMLFSFLFSTNLPIIYPFLISLSVINMVFSKMPNSFPHLRITFDPLGRNLWHLCLFRPSIPSVWLRFHDWFLLITPQRHQFLCIISITIPNINSQPYLNSALGRFCFSHSKQNPKVTGDEHLVIGSHCILSTDSFFNQFFL